jgi:hypothetical protein
MAKKKGKGGRPPRIPTTDEIKAAGALSLKGVPKRLIADALGLSETTFYVWLKRGKRASRGPFWEFSQALKKGRVKRLADLLDKMLRLAVGDGDRPPMFCALAWLMERGYQEHFALRYRTTVEGKGKGARIGPLVIESGPDEVLPPVDEGKT